MKWKKKQSLSEMLLRMIDKWLYRFFEALDKAGSIVDNLVQRMSEIKMNYYFTGALIVMLVVLAFVEDRVSNKPLNIGEEAKVQMPMKTVASLIVIVALGTMGYFQIIERLNVADTRLQLMEKDLEENTEFRIKWPRGQLGSLPADSEQFMMIEDSYKTTDKLNAHIESMALNKVNIEFLRKQMDKVLSDIEKLKDANRDMKYSNGNGGYSQ